ncbi:MAG TPA: tetratricopeptide repeat protein [Steroidobacteraceae bacterium]|jgi:tetratricopeptide (TPR) repeat protein
MKRTQRNLFVIMTVMALIYVVVIRLPLQLQLWLALGAVGVATILIVWGRDFFIGRFLSARRRWPQAIKRFERFEKCLLVSRWSRLAVVFYLSIYSFDGVAVMRNNIAHCLMNLRDFDNAQRWLREALRRDPQYALAYVNLGTIAALQGKRDQAEREMRKAVQLGFNPLGAQRILRKALEQANASGEHLQ